MFRLGFGWTILAKLLHREYRDSPLVLAGTDFSAAIVAKNDTQTCVLNAGTFSPYDNLPMRTR